MIIEWLNRALTGHLIVLGREYIRLKFERQFTVVLGVLHVLVRVRAIVRSGRCTLPVPTLSIVQSVRARLVDGLFANVALVRDVVAVVD